jgi:hypothetical protein
MEQSKTWAAAVAGVIAIALSACSGRILLGSEQAPTGGESGGSSGGTGSDAASGSGGTSAGSGAGGTGNGSACAGTMTAGGRCLVVLAPGPTANDIAVGGVGLYWTTTEYSGTGTVPQTPGSIMKVPIGGGASVEIASAQNDPWTIAVARLGGGDGVYWTNLGDANLGSVSTLLPGNVVPDVLDAELVNPTALGISDTRMMWASNDALKVATLLGQDPVPVVPSQNGASLLAVDDTNVYWSDGSTIQQAPIRGGAAITLVTEQGVSSIAIDATSVYWTVGLESSVWKIPIGGGTPTAIATGQSDAGGVAVDGASAYYWSDDGQSSTDGQIMKVDLAGGTPTVLAEGQNPVTRLRVDSTSVYWGNYEGPLMKLTPK